MDEIYLFEKEIIPLYPELFKYLLHLGSPQSVSHDIVQITMEKAWINREKLFSSDYKKQWLFRVAFNEYMSYLREYSKEYSYSKTDTIFDKNDADKLTENALDTLIKRENIKMLKDALDLLDPKYAIPIRLRYFGELSHKEISDVLGLNYNTTRSIIARGLIKLKTIFLDLEKQGKNYE